MSIDGGAFQQAFEATAEERAALEVGELVPVNLDVAVTVTRALGAAARLAAVRAIVVAKLPQFDVAASFDRLETYAGALAYANLRRRWRSQPDELPALIARGIELREILLVDMDALAMRGVIDANVLARVSRSRGYLDLSQALGVISLMLRQRWEVIAGRTAIQESDLVEARVLGERILMAVAARRSRASVVPVESDDRQRAFTLLIRAYDEVRRAVSYVRWHERDAEKLAPSLWTGRGRRRKAHVLAEHAVVTPVATETRVRVDAGDDAEAEPRDEAAVVERRGVRI